MFVPCVSQSFLFYLKLKGFGTGLTVAAVASGSSTRWTKDTGPDFMTASASPSTIICHHHSRLAVMLLGSIYCYSESCLAPREPWQVPHPIARILFHALSEPVTLQILQREVPYPCSSLHPQFTGSNLCFIMNLTD